MGTFAVPDDTSTRTDQGVPLGAPFSDLLGPVSFRIYGYKSAAAVGTWRIDNVDLSGTLAAVPEPSTFIAGALLALPFGMQGVRYLRNRKQVS